MSLPHSDIERNAQCTNYISNTRTVSEIINIEWQIHNFSSISNEFGFLVESPFYVSKQNPRVKWYFKFYPNSKKEESSEFCSLYLAYEGPKKGPTAKFKVTLMNKQNQKLIDMEGNAHEYRKDEHGWGFQKLVKRKDLVDKEILADDRLQIFSTIFSTLDKINVSESIYSYSNDNEPKQIIEINNPSIATSRNSSIGELFYEKDNFTDIKLVLEEETFNVHKIILSSASSIFMEMFEKLEGQNSINIKDLSSKIMREVLRYIYTKRIENLSDIANELVAVAGKYEVEGLKEECERQLCNSLTLANLLDMLIIADSYDLPTLYKKICHLFVLHRNEIVSTPKCREMSVLHPSTLSKLFITLIADKKM